MLALESRRPRLRLSLTLLGGRLLVVSAAIPPDALVRAETAAFAALAAGRLDPDTAFFQRRLTVEGDTSLALAARNALDGIDAATLPAPFRLLMRRF